MSVSALIGLSAFLFALVIASNLLRLAAFGLQSRRLRKSQTDEDAIYEERFRKLAAQALEGPLLLTDDREKAPPDSRTDPPVPPRMAPVSCQLSDPFERKFV